jgi:hypothetical protein
MPASTAAETKPFEIGLTMAGAISAGAYTAGVIDVLDEAVDAWELAKLADKDNLDGPQVPPHSVVIRAISGASAGGMIAAIAAVALGKSWPHIHADPGPGVDTGNPLFDAWVQQIDISDLLSTTDLDAKESSLRSLLNSDTLDRIVGGVLAHPGPPMRRNWIADPLPVRMTVGNLTGIPFRLKYASAGDDGLDMMQHGDYAGFSVSGLGGYSYPAPGADDAPIPDEPIVYENLQRGRWPALGQAALASGAFPAFLRYRVLTGFNQMYRQRQFEVLDAGGASSFVSLPPYWGADAAAAPEPYRMLCVDGGVINNEPVELVRQLLNNGRRSERGAGAADRAVLMIDPFPDHIVAAQPKEDEAAAAVIGQLIGAWKNQARFKPADLILALREDVYSRFLISPAGGGARHGAAAPIASAGLSGFLGFFDRAYRVHDFFLGRRNCQQFLREHFALAESNPLFDGWGALKTRAEGGWGIDDLRGPHLPVIPLMPHLQTELPTPAWPFGRLDDRTGLMKAVTARGRAVSSRLAQGFAKNAILRGILWVAYRWQAEDWLQRTVAAALDDTLKAQRLRGSDAPVPSQE